eukprot:gb/GECH01006801.1/.p1 GENE.gb/GECH01006801.1/~~gb/GECH01006801.1/.p1  ORF type:complete len:245 (+),score=47.12 gb/GECH01006801.1/:1-735(+)
MTSETSDKFFKFPRTHHLFDTGNSVSRDDLLVDDPSPFYKETVVAEEKVDGANLGISVDPNTLQLRAQNRSHYVCSTSAPQWSGLDRWLQEHAAVLFEVLYPNRILFGEWLTAQHTVFYDQLPSFFIAFDIYDIAQGHFLSVTERNRLLRDISIPIIRTVHRGVLPDRDAYHRLLDEPSAYTTHRAHRMEGVYLRIDDDAAGVLHRRAKLVRPEFISEINDGEHWSRKRMVKNVVDYSLLYDDL